MTAHTLTDAELARLEELATAAGKGTYSAGDGSAEGKWVAAACNAVPSLEAESARLRAERDWLAENVEGRPCDYDSCPFGLPRPTGPDYGCGKTHVQCWQKALTPRRAVAAGEGE